MGVALMLLSVVAYTVNQYLRNRQVPVELSDQVRDYYDYVWARYRGMDGWF